MRFRSASSSKLFSRDVTLDDVYTVSDSADGDVRSGKRNTVPE